MLQETARAARRLRAGGPAAARRPRARQQGRMERKLWSAPALAAPTSIVVRVADNAAAASAAAQQAAAAAEAPPLAQQGHEAASRRTAAAPGAAAAAAVKVHVDSGRQNL